MKQTVLILMMAACITTASAQPPAQPATAPTKAAVKTTNPATKDAVKPAVTVAKSTATTSKLPFGVPAPGIPAVKTTKNTAFSLRYQEIKVGDGAVAEPNKLYKLFYTGWLGLNGRADDGQKFDSTDDHPRPPVLDKDGKPELGPDGKPVQGPPQPMSFPQGIGRAIPGFDQGLAGMKVGGKRRIFIPWQLGYGTREIPSHGADHPGIPPKSDLIFDVELVDVSDMPAPPSRPGMKGMHPMSPAPGAPATPGAPPSAPGAAPKPPAGTAPAPSATPASPATPAPAAAPAAAPPTAPAPPTTPAPAAAPPVTPAPQQPK